MRYATKRSSSNQGRGVRRVRVVRAAHDDGRYKHGPIIVVEDLSDTDNPGQTKTLYVHRISEILGEPSDSGSDERRGDGFNVIVLLMHTIQ